MWNIQEDKLVRFFSRHGNYFVSFCEMLFPCNDETAVKISKKKKSQDHPYSSPSSGANNILCIAQLCYNTTTTFLLNQMLLTSKLKRKPRCNIKHVNLPAKFVVMSTLFMCQADHSAVTTNLSASFCSLTHLCTDLEFYMQTFLHGASFEMNRSIIHFL